MISTRTSRHGTSDAPWPHSLSTDMSVEVGRDGHAGTVLQRGFSLPVFAYVRRPGAELIGDQKSHARGRMHRPHAAVADLIHTRLLIRFYRFSAGEARAPRLRTGIGVGNRPDTRRRFNPLPRRLEGTAAEDALIHVCSLPARGRFTGGLLVAPRRLASRSGAAPVGVPPSAAFIAARASAGCSRLSDRRRLTRPAIRRHGRDLDGRSGTLLLGYHRELLGDRRRCLRRHGWRRQWQVI